MFKEPEKGDKDINIERVEEALSLNPNIIAAGCPFCMTMLSDGVKHFEKENAPIIPQDVLELFAKNITANIRDLESALKKIIAEKIAVFGSANKA